MQFGICHVCKVAAVVVVVVAAVAVGWEGNNCLADKYGNGVEASAITGRKRRRKADAVAALSRVKWNGKDATKATASATRKDGENLAID